MIEVIEVMEVMEVMEVIGMRKTDAKMIKNNKGFTFIEIIVAMTILALFITSFSALFVQSYSGIMSAGNKSKASFDAQADVEQRLAEKNANAEQNFTINFGSESVSIRGGVVSATKTSKDQKSSMDSFLALIPSMALEPYASYDPSARKIELYDGYPTPQSVKVIGTETHFSGSSVLSITDKNKASVAGCSLDADNDVLAEIELVSGLNSASSPYLVTITTGSEKVSAYLSINPVIKYAAVGDAGFIAYSSDGISWNARELAVPVAENNLNSIISHNDIFTTVGDSGIIMHSSYGGHVWTSVNLLVSEKLTNFKSIVWGDRKYVAVGTGGVIYTLDEDPAVRSCRVNGFLDGQAVSDLNGVAYGKDVNGFDKYVAVGANGTILVSGDAVTWNKANSLQANLPEEFSGSIPDFNAVTYGSLGTQNWFIAVGNSGIIAFSGNGADWYYGVAADNDTGSTLPVVNYNSVVCANGRIAAAGGSSVLVLDSISGGTAGTHPVINTNGYIKQFDLPVSSVISDKGKYYAIYDGNSLLYSEDCNYWHNSGKLSTATNMNSVCLR